MKKTLLFAFLFVSYTGFCQDTPKIQRIDSLVNTINSLGIIPQPDSIKQDYPALGMFIHTYIYATVQGTELKKYVNDVYSISSQNQGNQGMHSTNSFYFYHNQLIKVEDQVISGTVSMNYSWYYENDQPIYFTAPKSEKTNDRAEMLGKMGKDMVSRMGFKPF